MDARKTSPTVIVKLVTLFVLLVGSPRASSAVRKSYHGHRVLQVLPNTSESVEFLNELVAKGRKLELDFWTYPSSVGKPVDIHVSRNKFLELKHLLNRKKIPFSLKVSNVQRLINQERTRVRSAPFDAKFNTYNQIVYEMRRLAKLSRSAVTLFDLGKTHENRTIYALKIKTNTTKKDKPLFFMNCGIHAREWITISTCMYIARQFVLNYTDSAVKQMVDQMEWVIVPVINVDGYVYTHTTERLWRKNRRKVNESFYCVGTDLNRNFNYEWASVGSEPDNPCSNIYPGDGPFSEIEALSLAKYLYSRRHSLKVYIDFHSYGQLWLSPWGCKRQLTRHFFEQRRAMNYTVQHIRQVHGKEFAIGPAAIVIYPTSGDVIDWVYGTMGVVHSYGVELRPEMYDEHGFVLPPSNIVPVGEETLRGLQALCSVVN